MNHLTHRIRRHSISFGHAFEGIMWVLRTQPNYHVHLALCVLSVIGGVYWQIERYEWMILLTLMGMGLTIETVNSALEQTLDCVSLERRADIKIAKDASAAAMLVFAMFALGIAIMIFGPHLISL